MTDCSRRAVGSANGVQLGCRRENACPDGDLRRTRLVGSILITDQQTPERCWLAQWASDGCLYALDPGEIGPVRTAATVNDGL
jgi:hypothetical protein